MKDPNSHFLKPLALLLAPFDRLNGQKLRLIIHAGTPKTGTTSVQTYLDKKQRKLRGKGILYPHNLEELRNPTAPKHHWLEKNLVSTHREHLLENFKNIISQVKDDTHTIILSSEGFYNYWWDFSDESKCILGELNALFDIQIWVWFREPLGFIESYYKQCIRNPQVEGNSCYGKDLSFAEMLDIEWFSQHLNYQGFVAGCQALFGSDRVMSFKYEGDVVQNVIQKLGMETPHDNPTPKKNISLNSTSIAILRAINQLDIKAKDKKRAMPHLKNLNEIFEGYENESLIDDESRERVLNLAKPIKF